MMMKRFFTAIASAVGLSTTAATETKMVDPKTIYFSLATINDALPVIHPATHPTAKDLVIHEDDWRQFEAVALSHSPEIKEEIADVQRIYKEKSKPAGGHFIFSTLHIRKRIVEPLPIPINWTELLSACGVQAESVAGVGLRSGQGMVDGGFSFHVGLLGVFGVRHGESVEVLCFEMTRLPSVSEEQALRLAAFFEKSGVVFVHWPSATVFAEKKALIELLLRKN